MWPTLALLACLATFSSAANFTKSPHYSALKSNGSSIKPFTSHRPTRNGSYGTLGGTQKCTVTTAPKSSIKSTPKGIGNSTSQPTCIIATTITTTITSTPVSTVLATTSAYRVTINGDDGYPLPNATVTYTYVQTVTTTGNQTYIVTSTITPTTKIGIDQTTTAPAPSGFRPINETLSSASWVFEEGGPDPVQKRQASLEMAARTPALPLLRRACKTVTSTVASTYTAPVYTTTSTATFDSNDCVYVFPLHSFISVACADYTTYNVVVNSTVTVTAYTNTSITTVTDPSTSTFTATTTTLYEACNRANLANYKYDIYKDTYTAITGGQEPIVYEGQRLYEAETPYDCCAIGIENPEGPPAEIWSWFPNTDNTTVIGFYDGPYCVIQWNTTTCNAQTEAQKSADIGTVIQPVQTAVIGNGLCGEYSGYYESTYD